MLSNLPNLFQILLYLSEEAGNMLLMVACQISMARRHSWQMLKNTL